MNKIKKSRIDYICILVLFLLGIGYFCFGNMLKGLSGDGGDGHYALWAANARLLHNGEFPLWNPYVWGGYGNVGHICEAFYPILVVLEYLFWDNKTETLLYSILPAYNAIHFVIGCFGMYILGRIREKKPIIAFTVTILVMFSGCFTYGVTWSYIFGSYCWIIWLITFLYLLVETGKTRYVISSGLILSMIGLCATAQGILFAVLVYIVLFIVALYINKMNLKDMINLTAKFLLSGFIGMGLASVELLPFIETNMYAFRFVPGIDIASNNGDKISLGLFTTDVSTADDVRKILGGYKGVVAICCIAFLLILFSFFIKYKTKDWFLVFSRVFMIGSFLYAIGFAVCDVFWYLPGYNAIREPILYAPFVIMMGGILMLESLEFIYEALSDSKTDCEKRALTNKKLCIWLIVITLGVMLLPHMIQGMTDIFIKSLILAVIILLIFNKKINEKIVVIFLLVICICNLNLYITYNTSDEWFDMTSAQKHVADVHAVTVELFKELDSKVEDGQDVNARYLKWSPTDVLPSNEAGVIGEYDCFAYLNPIYQKTYYFYQLADLKKRVQLQNIKYILFAENSEGSFKSYIESLIGKESWNANTLVYPSYNSNEKKDIYCIDTSDLNLGSGWVAGDVELYTSSSDTYDWQSTEMFMTKINNPETNLEKKVYVDTDSMDSNKAINVTDVSEINYVVNCKAYNANEIEYEVTTNQDGIFVATEFYYPGWYVTIDGKSEDLLQVDYAFRGVQIKKGKHIVKFYYFPNSLKIGMILGGLAILAILFCLVITKKRGSKWIK